MRKGAAPETLAMKNVSPLTSSGRAKAVARLRSLTIGTAIASVAGVAGFGLIAAASDPGSPTIAIADDGGTSTSGATTTTTTTTGSSLQATATPTPATAPAHVTSGSS